MNAVRSFRDFDEVPLVPVLFVLAPPQFVEDVEEDDEVDDNDTPPSYRPFVKHVDELILLLVISLFIIRLSFFELQINDSDS